jgi:hypothetical protein
VKYFVVTRQMLMSLDGELWGERIEQIVREKLGNGPLKVSQNADGDYVYEKIPSGN